MPVDTSGRKYPLNLKRGVGVSQALIGSGYQAQTLPPGANADAGVEGATVNTVPLSKVPSASPSFYLIGLVLILVTMHVVGRHSKLGEVTDNYAGVNVWNFLSTGLMATVFILTLKLGINKSFPTSTAANVANFI